jgi:chemotaxis protein methyltransferase CheR
MERFLLAATVHVTSMFRDPCVFQTLRTAVLPQFANLPLLRVWTAGCASGEEAYSVAILLVETGLYDRSLIYATDASEVVIASARAGSFPLAAMRDFTTNYLRAGGERSFSEYYRTDRDRAVFDPALKANIVFGRHNLVTDSSLNEFHLVFCRNVMIYFNDDLSARVHRLIYNSLPLGGYFALGSKESIRFTPFASCYEEISRRDRIYRKTR